MLFSVLTVDAQRRPVLSYAFHKEVLRIYPDSRYGRFARRAPSWQNEKDEFPFNTVELLIRSATASD